MPKPFICPDCGFDCELAPRHDCEAVRSYRPTPQPSLSAEVQAGMALRDATLRCEAVMQFAHHLMRKVDLLMAQGILAEAEKTCAKIQRRAHKRANWVRNPNPNRETTETNDHETRN